MKFRKKPVVIDAVQFVHDVMSDEKCASINCGTHIGVPHGTKGGNFTEVEEFIGEDSLPYGKIDDEGRPLIGIDTLEGTIWASPGDWIIRGVEGEHYPCKPDIFEKTYERTV